MCDCDLPQYTHSEMQLKDTNMLMKNIIEKLIKLLELVLTSLEGKFTFTTRRTEFITNESLFVIIHIKNNICINNDINLYELVPQLTVCEQLITSIQLIFNEILEGKINLGDDIKGLTRFNLESPHHKFFLDNDVIPLYKIGNSIANVYKCYDCKHNQFVAVKLVNCTSSQYDREFEYFNNNPQVRSEKNENTFFGLFVLPYVNGSTLKTIIENESDLERFSNIIPKFRSIANQVQFLFSNNLIHRDISCYNCLSSFSILSKNNQVPPNTYDVINLNEKYNLTLEFKLIDFGCARELDNVMTVPVGNREIMAPEIGVPNNGEYAPYDKSADVFSLGCIYYQYICRKPIADFISKCTSNYYGHLLGLHIEKTNLKNVKVQKMIITMLRKDPKQRPSIEEIVQLLNN